MTPGALRIGIIGDLGEDHASHRATDAALAHAASDLRCPLSARWLPSPGLLGRDPRDVLAGWDGLFAGPGSPNLSQEGTLRGIRFAREEGIPLLATCGGFQHAMLEYARNVLGIPDAEHAEYDPEAKTQAVVRQACPLAGRTVPVRLKEGSRIRAVHGRPTVDEQAECHYGLNPDYQDGMEASGFRISGADGAGEARVLELDGHPFYVATLYLPQLTSAPGRPHPLVRAFLEAVLAHRKKGNHARPLPA